MPSPKRLKFLNEIMSCIKFPFDKKKIRTELEAHLDDKIDFYMQNGYDSEVAEKMAISDMGNSKEIGKALNKQHNPVIGWVWMITNVITIIAVVLSLYFSFYPLLIGLVMGSGDPIKNIPENNIKYILNINKTVRIDDTSITFSKVICEKNGNVSIIYKYNDKKIYCFDGKAYTFTDNTGKNYKMISGWFGGYCHMLTFNEISKNAEYLLIDYDLYNRKYRVEIPLKRVS